MALGVFSGQENFFPFSLRLLFCCVQGQLSSAINKSGAYFLRDLPLLFFFLLQVPLRALVVLHALQNRFLNAHSQMGMRAKHCTINVISFRSFVFSQIRECLTLRTTISG